MASNYPPAATASRNIVEDDEAELNRDPDRRIGRYTFNAFTADDYEGPAVVFGCVRVGEHAHVRVESGRAIGTPPGQVFPQINSGRAGKLILRWPEWLVLRDALDLDPRIRIAEIESPTEGQVKANV